LDKQGDRNGWTHAIERFPCLGSWRLAAGADGIQLPSYPGIHLHAIDRCDIRLLKTIFFPPVSEADSMYIKIEQEHQIELVAQLAREIWTDHFGGMFPEGILEQIIDRVQSKTAISRQIAEGVVYCLIPGARVPAGYFAYRMSEPERELFLSKLYIRSSERRKGIGRQVVRHLEAICRQEELSTMRLTVYHQNTGAMDAYRRMGFNAAGTIHRDLGDGLEFNDIQMQKTI
jgi:ribosomal protein S18 acetylase RimI-like enzyme